MNLLRPTFNSNSSVVIENVFSEGELEELMLHYNAFYESSSRSCIDKSAVTAPLTEPVEKIEGFGNIISRKKILFDSLEKILGKGYQFLGSETINVGNDSHGPHRDCCYKHDVVKILICLSDRMPDSSQSNNERNSFDESLDGSFLVFPGSHNIYKNGFGYSQLQTQWPRELRDSYSKTPDTLHYGDQKANGDCFYPYDDAKSRYPGFSKLTFKKGDVILFSTRAVHALYPQRESHIMHFIGLLFVEDFNQGYNKVFDKYSFIRKAYAILSLEKLRELMLYACLPANMKIIGEIMRDKEYAAIPKAQGIRNPEILRNPGIYKRFTTIQYVHDLYELIPTFAKRYFLSEKVAKKYFFDVMKATLRDLSNQQKLYRRSNKQSKIALRLIKSTKIFKKIQKFGN